jgi:crotonobetainyl-CoA:carnitine CoA-transferase CaiB-like acyl-CoA transferase
MVMAPLTGIRVLDLGRYIAAPYCAMVLGDLGAEVIRVERPRGEEDRYLGLRAANGETYGFASLARGKRAVTLDLRQVERARPVLSDLVARSDVFVHNFGPGAAGALGLGYGDIRSMAPAIVYVGISFAGADGPHANRTGFDMMAQMGSGAAAVTGLAGEPPLRAGVPWVDYSTGLSAAIGVLAALRQRDATGEGQAVDCALLQTALSYTAPIIAEAVAGGRERPRLGNQTAYTGPSNLYRCRDGHVYVAAITSSTWRALAAVIGRPELARDAGLRTAEQRFERRADLDPLVEAWTSERNVAEALAALEAAQVPCGRFRTTADAADDPQVQAREMLGAVDLGMPGFERVPASRTPVRLAGHGLAPPGRPPGVGEHNDEVYGSLLGYGKARIAELRAAGVI